MFCTKCGKQIDDQSKFCSGCGAAVEQAKTESIKPDEIRPAGNGFNQMPPVQPAQLLPMNGLAIAGFVLSLISIFPTYVYLPGIIAIILSAVALSQIKPGRYRGRGLAIARLTIGIISVSLGVLVLLSCGAFGCSLAGTPLRYV